MLEIIENRHFTTPKTRKTPVKRSTPKGLKVPNVP
jgi:hypothetical protein